MGAAGRRIVHEDRSRSLRCISRECQHRSPRSSAPSYLFRGVVLMGGDRCGGVVAGAQQRWRWPTGSSGHIEDDRAWVLITHLDKLRCSPSEVFGPWRIGFSESNVNAPSENVFRVRLRSSTGDVRPAVAVLFALAARAEGALDAGTVCALGAVGHPTTRRTPLCLLVTVKASGAHALATAEASPIAAVGPFVCCLTLPVAAVVSVAPPGFARGLTPALVVGGARRRLSPRAAGRDKADGQHEARDKRAQQLDKNHTGHALLYTSPRQRVTRASWP